MRYYGLYLNYGPGIVLAGEGLGRQLVAFLQGASQVADARLVIVCPTWHQVELRRLCADEGLDTACFEFHSPPGVAAHLLATAQQQRSGDPTPAKPAASVYGRWRTWRDQRREQLHLEMAHARDPQAWQRARQGLRQLARRVGAARVLIALVRAAQSQSRRAGAGLMRLLGVGAMVDWLVRVIGQDQHVVDDDQIRRAMHGFEAKALADLVSQLGHVRAWYAPAAFWPEFHQIGAPGLMCVPDVVMAHFPAGFAMYGARYSPGFDLVDTAIRAGRNYLTYSETVKWGTLVARYGVAPDDVHVVAHAPLTLDHWIQVTGMADNEQAGRHYCRIVMQQAVDRIASSRLGGFTNMDVRFVLYPSQLRPNKNPFNLLRAWRHLVRDRLVGVKLVLTSEAAVMPEADALIDELGLRDEVWSLPRLSSRELAAVYRLASLAINPSLSEGGFPFTFSEALSVGTPVCMARIDVTRERLGDSGLDERMYFDPQDPQDIARCVQWCLDNREPLLAAQTAVHRLHMRRTWADVVRDTYAALDVVASGPAAPRSAP